MTFVAELVADGIQYPADMVAGEDEQTLYVVNVQATPGGPYTGAHSSGQVLRVHMPDAPTSVEGATVTPIMGGLTNPCFLARARQSGRMVVQCYGYMASAEGQALLECPQGGSAWPCQRGGLDGTVGGPRGVALSPDGTTLYVFEDEIPFFGNYISGRLSAIAGGKETMWSAGSSSFEIDWYDHTAKAAFLKIDPAGEFLWVPGTWDLDTACTRIPVDARGKRFSYSGQRMAGRFTGVGFQDPLPNAMNPDPVWPFVPTPGFAVGGGYIYRFIHPQPDGTGYVRYDYRSPYTTGEDRFYNLKGLAVTPGGQVFVSASSFGVDGSLLGNHISLGAPNSPGCIFRVNTLLELPPDYADNTQPNPPEVLTGYPTPEAMPLVQGHNARQLLDDHSNTELGFGW